MRIDLEIGTMTIETDAEQGQLAGAGKAVQEAFRILSDLLAGMPVGRWSNAKQVLVEQMEISDLSLDELLAERGAHRLAELLYQDLLRKRNG